MIRALAIRTMGYIHVDKVTACLVQPLRHCMRDQDPYVRKTAAVCVAKLFMQDRHLVESAGFIDLLRDMLIDSNPSVHDTSHCFADDRQRRRRLWLIMCILGNAIGGCKCRGSLDRNL
jgi:hypothetical protein